MKLPDYLKVRNIRRNAFAELVGLSAGRVTQLCADDAWPTRKVAERIAEVTDGAVTPNDFVGLSEDAGT